jgi:hypothetical protein
MIKKGNNICSGNGYEPSDEDLMDLNSHKEKADQRTTTSLNKRHISSTYFLGEV